MSLHLKFVYSLSIGLLLIFAWHFATVFGLFGSAPTTRAGFFIRIGVIFAVFLISSAVTVGLIEKHKENASIPDEREEKLELKAERIGTVVVYIGLLIVMWFAFTPMTAMQIANAILGLICVSELVKLVVGWHMLKRGF